VAAKAKGSGLALVIFDRQYLPRLFATRRGIYLKKHVVFMKGKPWVRHDEHYHVDFAVACAAGVGKAGTSAIASAKPGRGTVSAAED
jgi:penicillin-insensitive murein endopeptidase